MNDRADHSVYSRRNCPPLFSEREIYDERNIRRASDALITALWREHPHILRYLGARRDD